MRTLLLTLALLVAPGNPMLAQEPVVVAGSVRTSAGVPILGANVFLLETLDGALVDTVGRFSFRTAARGPVTLVILATGYLEKRTPIHLPLEAALDVTLDQAPIALEPLRVEAGRFIAGDAPDVALTSLQVVTVGPRRMPSTHFDLTWSFSMSKCPASMAWPYSSASITGRR